MKLFSRQAFGLIDRLDFLRPSSLQSLSPGVSLVEAGSIKEEGYLLNPRMLTVDQREDPAPSPLYIVYIAALAGDIVFLTLQGSVG